MMKYIAFLLSCALFFLTPAHAGKVEISNVSWKQLPFRDAIVSKKGNGARKLVVFSDPRCNYCRVLSKELETVNNVTIYVFPVAYFDGSDKLVEKVWCNSNPVKTWSNLMTKNISPPEGRRCSTPADRNMNLAKRAGVTLVPTMMTEDGLLIASTVNKALLEEIFTITYEDK